jgi:hypothetical protein
MPDTMMMFEPLSVEECGGGTAAPSSGEKTPIIPVPHDAPPMRFRHPKYGYPTAEYAYHVASGELAGYACRFDFIDDGGNPDKEVLPITFCDLGNGTRAWRSKGIPAPRPLYRLPDIVARSDASVLICEGEKPANASPPPRCTVQNHRNTPTGPRWPGARSSSGPITIDPAKTSLRRLRPW